MTRPYTLGWTKPVPGGQKIEFKASEGSRFKICSYLTSACAWMYGSLSSQATRPEGAVAQGSPFRGPGPRPKGERSEALPG